MLTEVLQALDSSQVETFVSFLEDAYLARKRIFICGNGGSAGNALHIANDFSFGVNPFGLAVDIEALPANTAVITCLANDIGYENIFSYQLESKGKPGDLLWVLSGSGNSKNILNAITVANKLNMRSIGILGYDGGESLRQLNFCIHTPIQDMQISEDMQLIIGHVVMRELKNRIETRVSAL